MCITFFCLRPPSNKQIKMVIAFNRDEQSQRQTLPFGPFEDDEFIYAGRDVPTGGTWLGLNIKTGIMVILTNYDLEYLKQGKSRGKVVRKLLNTSFIEQGKLYDQEFIDHSVKAFLNEILAEAETYKSFNMLVYNLRSESMFYICTQNGMKEVENVQKQTCYSLCNSDLHTVWPKTQYGLAKFQAIIEDLSKSQTNREDWDILGQINEKIMRDNKPFTQNADDESSIFIEPFFSNIQKAQRETKQTFLAIVREAPQNGKSLINLQEITYEGPKSEEVRFSLTI